MQNTKKSKKSINSKIHFGYMCAGLIDGDGSGAAGNSFLGISKKNYTSCEITVGLSLLSLLLLIKKNLGGKISLRTKANAYRWKLNNEKGMRLLVQYINGKCLLFSKKVQLENVCKILEIPVKINSLQTYTNTYWVAGFFEAKGFFNVNKNTLQCSIAVSQKTSELLENLKNGFGGNVYYDKSLGYLYSCSDKISLNKWFIYFSRFPLKSRKNIDLVRFKRIVSFKEKKYHISNDEIYRKRFFKLIEKQTQSKKI